MFWVRVGGRFGIGLVGVERRRRRFAKYYISVDYKNKSFAFAVITERGISTGGIQPIIRGQEGKKYAIFPKRKKDQVKYLDESPKYMIRNRREGYRTPY